MNKQKKELANAGAPIEEPAKTIYIMQELLLKMLAEASKARNYTVMDARSDSCGSSRARYIKGRTACCPKVRWLTSLCTQLDGGIETRGTAAHGG